MESEPTIPFNRPAIGSAVLAVLTVILFCVGVAPIPLSSLVCYPFAALTGLASLWMGVVGLRQVRQTGERGRRLAWIGVWSGGVVILAILCAMAVSIALYPTMAEFIRQMLNQPKTS